jgi:hypothetical protein
MSNILPKSCHTELPNFNRKPTRNGNCKHKPHDKNNPIENESPDICLFEPLLPDKESDKDKDEQE